MQIIQHFIIDADDSVIIKAKECDEILKAKILQIANEKSSDLQDLIHHSLINISENFENENLNVKNWCLGWLSFLLNIDMSLHQFYGKIVINLIQFLYESQNSEITTTCKRFLEQTLNRFSNSPLFKNIDFSLNFLNELLALYVIQTQKENEKIYEKCDTILNWCILISKQLHNMFTKIQNDESKVQVSGLENMEANSNTIEEIFFNSIIMITTYSKHKKSIVKEKLGEYNEVILSLFDKMNMTMSQKRKMDPKRYKRILRFSSEEMMHADDQTIQFLIQWNEKIFQAIGENYIDHIENLIKTLDSKNDVINNNVIKFISNIIKQLNDPVLTKRIFCYFLQNNKNENGMDGFLKFLKILFTQFPDLQLFMSLIHEVSTITDKKMLTKVVQSFHMYILFENNFAFARELLHRIRIDAATTEDKDNFIKIIKLWCHDKISLFGLTLFAKKYELAYQVISGLGGESLKDKQLLQLTTVAKMLELPYSSQIRIDLLEPEQNYDLIKSLQFVMMILPQSDSYVLLKNRLKCVFYFSTLPKLSIDNSKNQSNFDQELEKEYKKSLSQIN